MIQADAEFEAIRVRVPAGARRTDRERTVGRAQCEGRQAVFPEGRVRPFEVGEIEAGNGVGVRHLAFEKQPASLAGRTEKKKIGFDRGAGPPPRSLNGCLLNTVSVPPVPPLRGRPRYRGQQEREGCVSDEEKASPHHLTRGAPYRCSLFGPSLTAPKAYRRG